MSKKQTTPAPTAPGIDAQWQVENDADTLMRAEQIKADKKRCAAAMKIVAQKQKAMASLQKGVAGRVAQQYANQ